MARRTRELHCGPAPAPRRPPRQPHSPDAPARTRRSRDRPALRTPAAAAPRTRLAPPHNFGRVEDSRRGGSWPGAGNTNRARQETSWLFLTRRGRQRRQRSVLLPRSPVQLQKHGPSPPAGPLRAPTLWGRHPAPPARSGRSTSRLLIGCAVASGRGGGEGRGRGRGGGGREERCPPAL
ncbi:uncharacterized protein LOC144579719 [Callithrix jacchus]